MALFGPPKVDKLKSEGNIKGLIKALGYTKDSEIAESASLALIELAPMSIEPLVNSLSQTDEQISENVAKSLFQIGMPATDALFNGLENFATREKCAEIIREMGDPVLTNAIGQTASWALEGGSKAVEAVRALGKLGPQAADQLIDLLDDPRTKEHVQDVNPSIYILKNHMNLLPNYNQLLLKAKEVIDQGSPLRRMIAGILGQNGGPDAVNPLIKSLDGEGDFFRWVTFGSLFQIGSPSAMKFLNEHLDDSDLLIFGYYQGYLLLGDGITIKNLLKVLLSDQEKASQSAAETLRSLLSRLDGFNK